MTLNSKADSSATLAPVYVWGARLIGAVLLIGILAQAATILVSIESDNVGEIIAIWPAVAMFALWVLPVFSLLVAGCTWVVRDLRDWIGWMATGIGVFLSSLWILQ